MLGRLSHRKNRAPPRGPWPFARCSEVTPFPDLALTFPNTADGLGLAP